MAFSFRRLRSQVPTRFSRLAGTDGEPGREAREVGDVFPSCDEQKNIVIEGVKGSTEDVFCRIESNVKNLTIRNVRGNCGTAAFTNIGPDGDCFGMENVLLEDWMIEGCIIGVEIGGGVTCSNFTLKLNLLGHDRAGQYMYPAFRGGGNTGVKEDDI